MDLENEKDIDAEALQAQIDLSMSFAQDMVSSWVKPHKLPKSSRRNELELELKEYLKKPLRLGVGAAIPTENQSMTRETARLKGRLTGSKRNRDEEGISGKRKSPSEEADGEESRAGAIQKKQRVDPFAGTHGKKKKKPKDISSATSSATSQIAPKIDSTSTSQLTRPHSESKQFEGPSKPDTPNSPKMRKTPESHSNDGHLPPTKLSKSTSQANGKINGTDVASVSAELPSPQKKAVIDHVSQPPMPSKSQPKAIPPVLLKKPLLNLAGPPESDSDEALDASPTSPKKKRKRRKKKKNVTGTSDPQGSAAATT